MQLEVLYSTTSILLVKLAPFLRWWNARIHSHLGVLSSESTALLS